MKYRWVYGGVISLWVCSLANAQLPQIENYSGDLWSRPALTGDWGGLRNTTDIEQVLNEKKPVIFP